MFTNTLANRLVMLSFVILVGYSIAQSIQTGSNLALFLAFVSLAAGAYFVYLLARAKADIEQHESQ